MRMHVCMYVCIFGLRACMHVCKCACEKDLKGKARECVIGILVVFVRRGTHTESAQ